MRLCTEVIERLTALPPPQAYVHGLSEKQIQRLAAHDLRVRKEEEERLRLKEEEEERERERRASQAVPSVTDMEQMQYLSIQ